MSSIIKALIGNRSSVRDKSPNSSLTKLSSSSLTSSQLIIQFTPPVPRETNPHGLTIKNFEISRTLGTGSFGRVHIVKFTGYSNEENNFTLKNQKHCCQKNEFYAMKVLIKSEVVRLQQIEHTVDERNILASVEHPFAVDLYCTFQDSKNLYLILEFVPGGELFSILRKAQRFPAHVAKFYAAEVLLFFEYLHSKGLVYRDLKPENLLIGKDGHLKVTDFGFAKFVPGSTYTLCGTPDYLAPEIILNRGYTKAVDWYSLGILIYEMIAGVPPFYHPNPLKLYENISIGKPKFPSWFDPLAKDLVKHLLDGDLTKRYGNLRGGVADIKEHKWFSGVDWDKLLRKEIPAPYIPSLAGGPSDTSNFDVYPEDSTSYYEIEPMRNDILNRFKDF